MKYKEREAERQGERKKESKKEKKNYVKEKYIRVSCTDESCLF
jgi:hypothetical protein